MNLRDLARQTGIALRRAVVAFYNSDNLTYAASIAYYALLSLFPFAMLSLAALGRLTADDHDRAVVLDFVLRYFPSQFAFITDQLDAFRANTVSLGIAGTIALVWGAFGVFNAISTAVNYAWRVEQPRAFWRQKLFSFVIMLLAGAVLVVALLMVSAAQLVGTTSFAGVLAQFPGLLVLRSLAIRYATTAMFVLGVGLVYYFVPNARVRFRDVWIGAFLTGGLWKAALSAFSWYMSDMSRFTRVNGSIAGVVVFLVWVYVQAAILLYGVEFTAAFARLRRGDTDGPGALVLP